ncbi:hypothetical protein OFN22_26040, partial [Escherichia coli]|nr:hypothetical protein [Escherichia coli]
VAVSLWDRHAVGYLTTGRLFTCRRCIHAVGPQNSYTRTTRAKQFALHSIQIRSIKWMKGKHSKMDVNRKEQEGGQKWSFWHCKTS